MNTPELCFWSLAGCVAYTYLLYPLLLGIWARLWPRPVARGPYRPRSVSIVVAARDEEKAIDRRLEELTTLLACSGLDGEVIVVSDGSVDGTAAVARTYTKASVRVLELPRPLGKATALSAGCAAAQGEVLVFADVRQSWAPDALERLLENFADPSVGAVSGNLLLERAPGALAGVGVYWRFEKWLRLQESLTGSMPGATGAISAVRRELFRPIPRGTILDDVYWPLQVALQGYRVVLDLRARAHDRLPERPEDEFRRKVRTLTGNFQLAARLPAALLPWRNPVWLAFVSHKLLRLVVPWALLGLFGLSLVLPGGLYRAALAAQVLFYGLGLVGLWAPGRRPRGTALPASFLVLNGAAWVAFWVWALGRAGQSWRKVAYDNLGPTSAVAVCEGAPQGSGRCPCEAP